jgi:hypothetical protein
MTGAALLSSRRQWGTVTSDPFKTFTISIFVANFFTM